MTTTTPEVITLLQREKEQRTRSKQWGTDENPWPAISGWCNPYVRDGGKGHERCSGRLSTSPTVGVMGCICPCHTPAASVATATAVTGWTWEPDAAAEIMMSDTHNCPVCDNAWEQHRFLDDGGVACDE